jgi:hypothetical protein
LAVEHGVTVVPVGTAMVEQGRDLGDRTVVDLKRPSVAVVSEEPTRTTAFGAIWYLLESHYQIPFSAIKGADLMRSDLRRYNVIVLPDGSPEGYTKTFGESGVKRLKNWVSEGGTLVCIKGAARWAAGEEVDFTSARERTTIAEKTDEEDENPVSLPLVPGAMVRVNVDNRHFLGLGVDRQVTPLIRSNFLFSPTRDGAVVARIDGDSPVASGFVFEESPEILKNAPYLWHEPSGRGHVICFADDVTFRTFLHGSHQLFLNSILLPPSGKW